MKRCDSKTIVRLQNVIDDDKQDSTTHHSDKSQHSAQKGSDGEVEPNHPHAHLRSLAATAGSLGERLFEFFVRVSSFVTDFAMARDGFYGLVVVKPFLGKRRDEVREDDEWLPGHVGTSWESCK